MPLLLEKEMIILNMSVTCTQKFVRYIVSVGQNHHFFFLFFFFIPPRKSCTYGLVFHWFLLPGIQCYEGKTMSIQKSKGKQVNH